MKIMFAGDLLMIFSIKAAYHDIEKDSSSYLLLRKIWKWPIYDKMKCFLWKMAHNKLHPDITTNDDKTIVHRMLGATFRSLFFIFFVTATKPKRFGKD